jgi:peptidoglycan/LPS O-acetylase OafA/YrhL
LIHLKGTKRVPANRMNQNAPKSKTYRPDVDGLRAIAIISVLLFHCFPGVLRGGFVGVDVFFVISGFLITGILLREKRISIPNFYSRRVRRIFPALALVLFTVLCLGWALLLPVEFRALGRYTLTGSLFSANIALWRDSGYFDAASGTKPLLHLWSLGVEEQYYFVWPLFVALLRRRRAFIPAMAGAAVVSFGLCQWATSHARSAAFYLPITRFWELAVGGGVAAWYRQRQAGSSWSSSAQSWIGVLLVVAGMVLISEGRSFPGAWALLPVVGTALIIGGGGRTLPVRMLSSRAFVAVGVISYPLYLWHWPLLTFGRILLGDAFKPYMRVVVCALSVGLAAATYLLVERRVRSGTGLWTRPWVLLGAVAAVGLAGGGVFVASGFPLRMKTIADAQRLPPLTSAALCPAALKGGDLDGLNICSNTGNGPATVALLGDSHAKHLFGALAEQGGRWLLLGNSSCPPLLGVSLEGDQKGCAEKFQRILDYLRSSEGSTLTTVLVTFYSGYALDEPYSADHIQGQNGPESISINGHKERTLKEPLFERGLEAYLVALLETGKRIILVEDVPEFPFFPARCAGRPAIAMWIRDLLGGTGPCVIDRTSVQSRQSSYLAMSARLAAKHKDLVVFHTLDHVCTSHSCPVLGSGGQLLYDDSHHISLAGGRVVARAILDQTAPGSPPSVD